ncbi:methionine synthase reductase [Aplysia californica]|uniref:Methionine synthase reductase n=1 Tax=Aplysia californica TaxID=6500 RepID=A0ABM0JIL0_APLCA|nr:methionine synthase reductase [Aplysia californica]
MSPANMSGGNTLQKNRFLVLYGSATGQAQAMAEEICEKATGFGLTAELHPMDEIGKRFNLEHEQCVVMVASTTGDGDPPPNAEKFMRRIKKRTLPTDYLAHLHYALLGLGDTNYSSFCRCAKDLDNRLLALGARQFFATGFADDGVGLEIVAEPWLEGIYPALQKFLGVTEGTGGSLTEKVEAPAQSSPASVDISEARDSTKQDNVEVVLTNSGVRESQIESQSDTIEAFKSVTCDEISVKETRASEGNGDGSVQVKNSQDCSVNGCDAELTVEVQSKILGQKTFFDSQRKCETPCQLVDFAAASDAPCALVSSDSELAEKSLTVPVLPPAYLEASFSGDPVNLRELSFQNDYKLPSAVSPVIKVQVSAARVLTHPQAVKKTLLLSLNLQGAGVNYRPGDSISVICPNNCSEVDMLLERLGISNKADDCMTLNIIPNTKKRRAAVPSFMHEVSTLRHTLTTCLNIREPPSKAFIRALVEHTTNPKEARRMQELCSKEGAQTYTRVVREKCISLLDFLHAFPSCKPPVERVLEHLPRLQPRPYSACSCALTDKDKLDIVFNIVEIPMSCDDGHAYSRRGVCTGWLDDITRSMQDKGLEDEELTVEIPIFLRSNQHFQPPDDLSRPLILIGPGTGVAPFIGFLEERRHQLKLQPEGSTYGETWLFYGCRHQKKDFLFRDELHQFEADGTLSRLCVTFSRDDPPAGSTEPCLRYVQDFLRQTSQDIARLVVDEEALVYLCGDAKAMAKDVTAAFEDILQKEKGFSKEDANMYIMKKRIHKTFLEDVWT